MKALPSIAFSGFRGSHSAGLASPSSPSSTAHSPTASAGRGTPLPQPTGRLSVANLCSQNAAKNRV